MASIASSIQLRTIPSIVYAIFVLLLSVATAPAVFAGQTLLNTGDANDASSEEVAIS